MGAFTTPGGGALTLPPGARHSGALRAAPRWLLAAAIAVTAAMLLPLGFVLWVALQIGGGEIVTLLVRPRVAELLLNTALLVSMSVPASVAVGVSLAWLTERTDLPGHALWSALATAPLAVPAFVHGYAWVTAVPPFHGLFAAVLVSVLAYFPFVYLPVAAALRRLDPAQEDVAASLGLRPMQVMRRVVLPQLRLPVLGGALLIGLHMLAEYGLFALVRFDTFTTAIFEQYQSIFSAPAANMMAGVLVLLCLLLLMLEVSARGGGRYARLGSGSARQAARLRLSRVAKAAGLSVVFGVAMLSLGVPLATLGRWLLLGGAAVWDLGVILPVLGQTLALAGAGAILTTLAAMPIAWLSVRGRGAKVRLIEASNYISGALPGIVVALALVTVTIRVARPLYQTAFTVLLAYLILFLPRALIALRASIAQAPPELEAVAQSLGRSPFRALTQVTLRLAAPGAAAGAALVFLAVTTELTATLILAPTGTRTLATTFWSLTAEIEYVRAAPFAVLMIALSLPLTWVLYHQSRRAAGR